MLDPLYVPDWHPEHVLQILICFSSIWRPSWKNAN